MIRRLRTLFRDERGASLIELGLALPILSFMLLGMVDMARGFAAKLKLEQAAQSTIEAVQQRGYFHDLTSSPTSLSLIKAEAEARAGTGSVATATAYIECRNGASRTTAALPGTCPGGQTTARYVAVAIAKTYTPMFGVELAGANVNGTYSLTGVAALRFQ